MRIYQVDAFTDVPFRGNPAGVCILDQPAGDEWMKAVAREMNLSETAFLLKEGDGYRLRWFTPKVEVRLCGHATLASSFTLYRLGLLRPDEEAHFYTLSGLLTARKHEDWIALNFPAQIARAAELPDGLLPALGILSTRYVGKNVADFLIEVDSEQIVRDLAPDFSQLARIEGVRGIIVTARATLPGFDFVSRFFAPAVGVNEDPVTGSAHTALTPYWSAHFGKKDLLAAQVSERSGVLRVHDRGDRVVIEGQAVLVLDAELNAG